jgi:D-sedoheptulose 7-phosphate isomerase
MHEIRVFLEGKLEELEITLGSSEILNSGIVELSARVLDTLKSGSKILLFGNGGSAAEANHIAAEFVGKCVRDVGPQAAISLSENQSSITAIANDFGFEQIYSRQVLAIANPNDLVIGLSTSGNSKNVLLALQVAKTMDCLTVLLTSNQSNFIDTPNYLDFILRAPTNSTPRAQEIHLFWGHIISEFLEEYWKEW